MTISIQYGSSGSVMPHLINYVNLPVHHMTFSPFRLRQTCSNQAEVNMEKIMRLLLFSAGSLLLKFSAMS